MSHLSLEKVLKGLLVKTKGEFPSKTHSLIYFVEKMELKMDDSYYEFLFTLNKISVPAVQFFLLCNWKALDDQWSIRSGVPEKVTYDQNPEVRATGQDPDHSLSGNPRFIAIAFAQPEVGMGVLFCYAIFSDCFDVPVAKDQS